jgi:zinc finger SWIM domain-containing protein 3
MKCTFSSYPELILIDATYKLNNLRMSVYLLMSIDGNGQGEIVFIFLTTVETESVITKMVQTFKCVNPRWVDTKVVMSNKDFNEQNVFKKEFSQASVQICLFHTLRSFKREITTENMSIRPGEGSCFGNHNKACLF